MRRASIIIDMKIDDDKLREKSNNRREVSHCLIKTNHRAIEEKKRETKLKGLRCQNTAK